MFSNLFHMELIRYCKNKSTLAAVIATVFLFVISFLIVTTELTVIMDGSIVDESIAYSLQAFCVTGLASMFAFFMGLSVVFTTTSFYKNKIYYNINGVISSRYKLFWADVTVFFVLALSGTVPIMLYSFLTGRFSGNGWIYEMTDHGVVFCTYFVFCRIFFCMLGAYALSHIIKQSAVIVACGIAFQLTQGALLLAIAFYMANAFEMGNRGPVDNIISALIAPSQSLSFFATGENAMTPAMIIGTTSIPFAIIFIVAAVAAGRRIEV